MIPLEALLVTFVLVCALAAALLRDVLGAIIAFAAYSLGISVIWVFLRAPDVGLTEAAVGAGVTTVFFLLTIAKTVRPSTERLRKEIDVPAFAVSAVLVGVMATTLGALPEVGSPETAVATSDVTTYYLEHAYTEAGVKNAVTAVLASYRGFDTLGEAAVVYAAGLGLLVVFGREVFA